MRCPKCYGRIEKESKRCTKCFFDINKIKEKSSNKKAKEMKRSGDGDLVIESKILPNDVSKKKLALFCGLLGLFGGHYFYVGKMFRGLINICFTIFAIILTTLETLKIEATGFLGYIESVIWIGFSLVFLFTIFDFINILFNRFKVPVYVEED